MQVLLFFKYMMWITHFFYIILPSKKERRMNREILRLAVPSIITNITVPLLGVVDVAIMGHMGDARFIGAIAVGSMIFNVMYWLCGFLRMGTSGLTAQAYGREHAKRGARALSTHPASFKHSPTNQILRKSLATGLGIGLLIVALQWPLRLLSLWLMGPSAEVADLVVPYYNICVWGAPAVLGLYSMTGWFIGMQNTRIPMMIAIGQNIVNIVASLLFVFVLGMQVEGVALGTMLAQWMGFGAALLFWHYGGGLSKDEPLQDGSDALGADAPATETVGPSVASEPLTTLHFFRVNRDIFLRTLCLVAVNLYFTSAGAQQGAVMLAVNTLLMQLFTIFSYFMDGFAYAGEALAGRFYGARDERSLNRVIRCLFGWGAGMVVLFTLLYWLGGRTFLGLLTNDEMVVSASEAYFGWALLIPLCGVAAFVWDGVFIGLTATRGMLISCFVAALMFFVVWFAGRASMGNHALWLALEVYLFLRGMVQFFLFLVKKSRIFS